MNDAAQRRRRRLIPFDPATVTLVDYCSGTGSLMVRGNMPLYLSPDGTVYFAYDQLGKAIGLLGNLPQSATPFTFSDYTLLAVNLTNNQGSLGNLTCELATFGQSTSNPTFSIWPPYLMKDPSWVPTTIFGTSVQASESSFAAGGMVYWPVQACPADLPSYEIYINKMPGFQFAALIDYLHRLLTIGPRRLIYFHCTSGVNRTGAVNVAYFIKYGSYLYPGASGPVPMSLQTAYANAAAIAPKQEAPAFSDLQLVKAYWNFCHTGSPDTPSPGEPHQPSEP